MTAQARPAAPAESAPWRRAQDPPVAADLLDTDYTERTDEAMQLVEALTREYARFAEHDHARCPGGCPVESCGPFVVNTMLHYKAVYSDGRLGCWTAADIHDYLLDYFPRKVSARQETVGATTTCVRDFVHFMTDRGTFDDEQRDALQDVADGLEAEFVAACTNTGTWGPAKRLVMDTMVMEPEPLLAPLLLGGRAASTRTSRPGERRNRRKSARAARKRNRR